MSAFWPPAVDARGIFRRVPTSSGNLFQAHDVVTL
jgi:hypothetical protein